MLRSLSDCDLLSVVEMLFVLSGSVVAVVLLHRPRGDLTVERRVVVLTVHAKVRG